MNGDAWLEWSESSTPPFDGGGDGAPMQPALHLFIPGNSLASVVLYSDTSTFEKVKHVRLHPVLYEFLSQAENLALPDDGISSDFLQGERVSLTTSATPENSTILDDVHREGTWKKLSISVCELPDDFHIRLSCVFLDAELGRHLERSTSEAVLSTFQANMLGRICKQGCVLLLSTTWGFAIVRVSSIVSSAEFGSEYVDTAYQIPPDPAMWKLQVELPKSDRSFPGSGTTHESHWESTIPGYELLLQELVGLLSILKTSAAPTGILLTGCPGVGKTRLASCLANTYAMGIASRESTSEEKVFYLSSQELIFRAATESDLYQNVIVPGVKKCSLWIIDDLHLLERDEGDELMPNNMEFTIVQNSILQAVDEFKQFCHIVGIGQVPSRLPSGMLKVGRLEKHIEMLAPGQSQREKILEHILQQDVSSEETRWSWSSALAETTAGCVASDLVRVHQDAWTQCWARNSQEEFMPLLQWDDLRQATRSCVPSQLSELDVVKPRVFDASVSWTDIHEECWRNFGGYEHVKKDVFRQVVVPWKLFLQRCDDPSLVERSWLDPPSGVLFHGISGCGKTAAAKYMANSLGLSMIQVRASDILNKWLGGSEELLRSLFTRARAASPCILFLDEIDSIASNRAQDDVNDFTSRILSTLLNEMDGISSAVKRNKVLVVACTNRLKALDSALLRPGRLQEHFAMKRPTAGDLLSILKSYLRKVPLSDDLSLVCVSQLLFTQLATGADVEGLCREACLSGFHRAVDSEDLVLSAQDFQNVLQTNSVL